MNTRKTRTLTPTLIVAFQTFLAPASHGQSANPNVPTEDEVVQLSMFEVRAETDANDYRATESISASGISLPMADLPVPIQVVTSAMLQDRGVGDLVDAITIIPGLSTSGPLITGQQSFNIRGYSAPGLRNGLRLENDSTDSALIERIEVARGPSAVLYGSGATGGVVNRITKKPKFVQQGVLTVGAGNHAQHQALLDVTGPISIPSLERDGKPTLAYRFIGEHRHRESDIDWYESTQETIAGSLRWQPSDRAMFTFEAARVRRDRILWVEIPTQTLPGVGRVYHKDPTGMGYHFSIMGPDAFNDIVGTMFELQGTVQVAEGVTFHAIYGDYTADTDGLRARDIEVWAVNGRARLEADAEHTYQQLFKADILWDRDFGNVNSKVLVGYEWSTGFNRKLLYRNTWIPPAGFTISQSVKDALYARTPNTHRSRDIDLSAVRLNHFISAMDDRLHVLWGLRHDDDVEEFDHITSTKTILSGDTTYQVGAVYNVTPAIGVFVNHSTDFVANTQTGRNGEALSPQTGTGYDIGLKFSGGRFTGMISYFSTDRENIARRQEIPDDPSTPNVDEKATFFVLSGQEEASGVEFDVQVDFTDSWSAIFGGSFFDANTVSNVQDPAQVGLPPQDVVMNSFNFQTVYKFSTGSLKGWSFSVGGYWRDNFRTEGSASQINVQTDDHYVLNGFVRRAFEWNGRDITITLSVNNLLDKRGYIINGETFGPPLMAWASVRYDF